MASSTSCAGSSRSVPVDGANGGAALGLRVVQRARPAPLPSSANRVVTTEKSCSPRADARAPPPWRRRARYFCGHCGHGRALVRAVRGRLGQQLELGDRARALAQRVAHAVGAGVAAADHDHVLARGGDRALGAGAAPRLGPDSPATQRLRW